MTSESSIKRSSWKSCRILYCTQNKWSIVFRSLDKHLYMHNVRETKPFLWLSFIDGMCSKHLLHHPRAKYVVIRAKQAIHLEDEINDGNIEEGKRICENTSLTSCIRPTLLVMLSRIEWTIVLYVEEENERHNWTNSHNNNYAVTIIVTAVCVFTSIIQFSTDGQKTWSQFPPIYTHI
jgi:hypothetical protein